jgi:hypothetical protein
VKSVINRKFSILSLLLIIPCPSQLSANMATIAFDMSELGRSSLKDVENQLSSFEVSPDHRFRCLFYHNEHKRYCDQKCMWFVIENPQLFKQAQDALELEQVPAAKFSQIIRTLFCGWHHQTRKFTSYQIHYEKLWKEASPDRQIKVLDAFRNCHKDIFEELWKKAHVTMEERKQFRDSLKSFREDTSGITRQSHISQQSLKDPGTPLQQHPGADGIKTEHIIDRVLPSTDTSTFPESPQQHVQDQFSARPEHTPQSRSRRASLSFTTTNGEPENLRSVSGHETKIFDIIAAVSL